MRLYFQNFIYSLGGADYNVIQQCTANTKKQYRNLGWSVILCIFVAFISGADFTHQYTSSIPLTVAGGLLFAIFVFSFDYFLINSNSTNTFFKLLRVPVAIANVVLGTLALMVLLCQSKIDNKILLNSTSKITACDSNYQKAKLQRYFDYNTKVKTKEDYHNSVCFKEAKNGYAGANYFKKHAYCRIQDSILNIEKANIDSTEIAFSNTYKLEREALSKLTNNDFFQKCQYLPSIFSENWITLLVAICVFIITSYIEIQAMAMKMSQNPNDEYHQDLEKYITYHKSKSEQRLKSMQDHRDKMDELINEKENTEDLAKWAQEKVVSTLKKVPLIYKLKEYKRIFAEQGMPELCEEVDNILIAITNGSDIDKAMHQLINKINQN